MTLDVGVCLFPTGRVDEAASLATLGEELGLGFVGVGDVQSLWRDVYVTATVIASRTRRVRVGPWVTNPVTRDPSVTANAMLALDEVAGGRTFLGIGVGDGAVAAAGRKPATLAELAAASDEIREVVAAAKREITIYWAAAGARSLACGAEHGDGVIVSGWLVPDVMARTHAAIRDGLARRAAAAGGVELIFNTAISIDHDRRRAIDAAKPYVARALARSSSTWMPDWSEGGMLAFRERYDYAHHFDPEHALKDLVPDAMVARKAVAGTPGECAALLARIRDSGFSTVALIPVGDAAATMRRLATDVLPRL